MRVIRGILYWGFSPSSITVYISWQPGGGGGGRGVDREALLLNQHKYETNVTLRQIVENLDARESPHTSPFYAFYAIFPQRAAR